MTDQQMTAAQMIEQLQGQVVRLNNNEQELRGLIGALQARLDSQETELQRAQWRGRQGGKGGVTDDSDDDLSSNPSRQQKTQDIVDRKFFNPTPFTASSVFRE